MKSCFPIVLIIAFVSTGCGRESVPGGPGAGGMQAPGDAPQNPANTFRIVVPAGKTYLGIGESYTAVIEINRREEFHEEVAFEFRPPPGVAIEPRQAVAKENDDEVRLLIKAAAEAEPGPGIVQVTAMPASRQNPIHEEFEIEIGVPEEPLRESRRLK